MPSNDAIPSTSTGSELALASRRQRSAYASTTATGSFSALRSTRRRTAASCQYSVLVGIEASASPQGIEDVPPTSTRSRFLTLAPTNARQHPQLPCRKFYFIGES